MNFTEQTFDYGWYWSMTMTTFTGRRYAARLFRQQRYRTTRKQITIVTRIRMKRFLKKTFAKKKRHENNKTNRSY